MCPTEFEHFALKLISITKEEDTFVDDLRELPEIYEQVSASEMDKLWNFYRAMAVCSVSSL